MTLLTQLKARRKALSLKQSDMYLRVGISRQQYQYIESKGNHRLDTLSLVAEGLDCQLMLIPKDSLKQVTALLNSDNPEHAKYAQSQQAHDDLVNNPWQGILDDLAD